METNLYTVTIPPMKNTLQALSGILDKAAAHVEKFGTERRPASHFESALLQDRLIVDQFPLAQQIQVACDNAKGGAARLAGIEPPKFEDTEKTIAELKERIAKTIAFLDTIKPDQIIGQEERKVTLPYWQDKHFLAFDYVTEYLLPNFYFHAVTAYAILRKNGVPLGKADYMFKLTFRDN